MQKHFNLQKKPTVVRNIPNTFPLSNNKYFHKKFNIAENKKIIVNSGNLYFGERRINMLIDSIKEIDDACLVLIGNTSKHKELKEKISNSDLKEKIFFHDYISSNEIGTLLSNADIGLVYTWQPDWKSYWHSLPNRFFEYCMAGLPTVCTRQPEFVKHGTEFKNAVFYNGDNKIEFVQAIKNTIQNYDDLKRNAMKIKESISWEKEVEKLIEVYNSI